MLILLEIVTGHHFRQAAIAEKVGVTKQAVSEYLKKMRDDNLVTVIAGEYKATMRGTQLLHTQLLNLKYFLDASMQKLEIIETGAALAGNAIDKGATVGLVMKDGRLMAYSGKNATSSGVAMNDAQPGDDVVIKYLNGMVSLQTGTIHVIELPTPEEGGCRLVDAESIKNKLTDLSPDRVGMMGVVATAVVNKISWPYDFEFAAAAAAIEAAQRGLTVAVVCSGNEREGMLAAIEEYNSSSVTSLQYEISMFTPKTIKKK